MSSSALRGCALAAAIASMLALPAGAAAVVANPVAERGFDLRERQALRPEAPPPGGDARADLRRSLGSQGVLQLDPVTGTPRIVARLDGFLTPPSAADPAEVALGYVRDNLAAFGLNRSDLGSLTLSDRHTDIWGVTHLSWGQQFDGVPTFDNGLKAAVDERGRLINLVGSPQPDPTLRSTAPDFGAGSALALAQRSAGGSVALPRVTDRAGGPQRRTAFADGSSAHLVLFSLGPDRLGLSWRVLDVESSAEIYDTVVDADSGRVLRRQNLVDFVSGQAWNYFPNSDNDAMGLVPAQGSPDGGGPRSLKTFPAGWSTSTTQLNGQFAHVYTDVDDNANVPASYGADSSGQCGGFGPCGEIPPTSGAGTASASWNYTFTANPSGYYDNTPFTGAGALTGCFSVFPVCSWDIENGDSYPWRYNIGQNGTQVYYYVNTMHDWLAAAPFGFGPSEGFDGVDKVNAQILDGAASDTSPGAIPGTPDEDHLNNANMTTFPGVDTPPKMQMYLFTDLDNGSLPEVNGGDDASVIYHEYVHGLSARLVTSGPGQPALGSFQSRSMGEGWSDWYAMDYLEANNIDEDDRLGPPSGTPGGDNDGEVNMGIYVEGADIHGLRTMSLDCAVGSIDADCQDDDPNQAGVGGYTYGDLGKILCNSSATQCQPEVHADGEIWAQTLWQLRQRFRTDLAPGSPSEYDDPHAADLERVRAVITEGMRLSPPNPSMIEMRNAILQADQALFGGADNGRIWSVFAARGMGFFAASLGGGDTQPVQDFSTPPSCAGGCGALSGNVTESQSGLPVPGALVEILGPGNLFAQTDANGHYSIANVPAHTYPYVAVSANAYEGELRTNVNVGPGGGTLNMNATRDWAALGGGATLGAFSGPNFSGSGCGPGGAFDLDLGTPWGSTSPASGQGPGGAKSVTVALPQAVDVTTFAVDPGAGCGDPDSASTGPYKIETSPNNSAFTTAAQGTFIAGNNHQLNLVQPTAGTRSVRFVRFTMLGTQGPNDFMDAAEVEVWGKPAAGGGQNGGRPQITLMKLLKGQRLKTLIAKGLKMKVGASEAVRLSGRMQIAKGIARRLHCPRSIGGGSARLNRAGSTVLTMKLTGKARKKIKAAVSHRRLSKLPIAVTVKATDPDGNAASRGSKVTLKR